MSDRLGRWDVPYIPPQGVVPECLLPDACISYDDPLMARPLEPLFRFDQPQLRRVKTVESHDHDPLASLRLFIAKECAGLPHEHRPDIDGLRRAFRTGEFTERQGTALDWAFSGMRRKYAFPLFVAGARLPIFEVARCFWNVFNGQAFGCGPWLNQWADEPNRPHPSESYVSCGPGLAGSKSARTGDDARIHSARNARGRRARAGRRYAW